MIDRYSITASSARISERFSVDFASPFQPKYNAAPTQLLPVITSNSPQGVGIFYWGTSPEWLKNRAPGEKVINVRAETIGEKPALKRTMMRTRCIIPADGFYVWKRAGKKTSIPYRAVATDQDLFSFAGLWEEYEDTDGNEFHTFTMITTVANDFLSSIYERMPVMLDKASEKVWLNPESTESELFKILVSYPQGKMNVYPVSPRINDVKADVPSLITPTPPADQFGNLTLFD